LRITHGLNTVLERWLPEQRLFLKSDGATRFVRLSPATQLVGLGGTAVVLGWTIIASSILAIDALSVHGAREQAFRSREALPAEATVLSAGRGLGFANGHNGLMAEAFGRGADSYITANPDGAFHPDCITHLLAMDAAHHGRALIEAVQFPEEHPKFFSPRTLETACVSGACLLISRALWEGCGGFDPNIFLYCDDVDLSWTARRLGFQTLVCPRALFYHDVSGRGPSAWRYREMLVSGRDLGFKWGSPAFVDWTEQQMIAHGFAKSRDELPDYAGLEPVPGGSAIADFSRTFSFAPVRW
jgi:hypothetical protein